MKDMHPEAVIVELEERLANAMRTSDVEVIDELLADDVIFTNHEGRVVTKQEDLDMHRSGLLKLDALVASQRTIRPLGDAAVVAVQVHLAGRHGGHPFEGAFRFTRVWARRGTGWQVVAAHSCMAHA